MQMRPIPIKMGAMNTRSLRLTIALPVAALALAGCSSGGDGSSSEDGIQIVASTNVYGDIAEAVAGDLADVTSIITSSAQDPHEYEASAQDRLALNRADIVIENGGGYDAFLDALLESSDGGAAVLNAVDISGLAPADGDHEEGDHEEEGHEGHQHIEGFNEHVWYDFHTVEHVAEELSHKLADLDPDNAGAYEENYAKLAAQIEELEASAESLKEAAEGRGVAITEPVPLYLLAEVGLVNQTPEEFSEAVEEGADVPPRVLADTLELFDGDQVSVLAYNEQTEDSTTEQVRAAAEDAGVPVVDFTETLPDNMSYVEWQQSNIDNLADALS